MPDLPNVDFERDIEQFIVSIGRDRTLGSRLVHFQLAHFFFFKEYFENPAFRSDGLKIYPTLVIRGTGLYELWKTGRYKVMTAMSVRALTDLP